MNKIFLVLCFIFLWSCQKDGEPKIESCQSKTQFVETNATSTPVTFANADRISMRLQVFQGIKVQKVMLKTSNLTNLFIDIDFYRGSYLVDPDQGQLVGSASGVATVPTSSLTDTWFELSSPIDLSLISDSQNDGYSIVVRFAGGATLDLGSSVGAVMRSKYVTRPSSSSWGTPDYSNVVSIGLEGEVGCD